MCAFENDDMNWLQQIQAEYMTNMDNSLDVVVSILKKSDTSNYVILEQMMWTLTLKYYRMMNPAYDTF